MDVHAWITINKRLYMQLQNVKIQGVGKINVCVNRYSIEYPVSSGLMSRLVLSSIV